MEQKLGLALSGGGFRAAFFHLGVLAQMADRGLLRSIEVISTVSGGSIIGALYYLHVKRLLEDKPDRQITDQDYRDIITCIEVDFLPSVQRNLRMRTFINPWKNLKMCLPWYSRSDRIGELYDEYIYRRVLDPNRLAPIQMRELKIQPKGEKQDFYPLRDNTGRQAKVPVILMNATTLNTGHSWRFEASHMGEPPRAGPVARKVNKNMRLRRPTAYEHIVKRQQDIELGLAVAASACVPGIFPPLAISGLYSDIRVQLVDGGVNDNQGIQGLIDPEMNCTHFVVSDASGQLEDDADPTISTAAVLERTKNILMERVREEELSTLFGIDSQRVALMHLRKGLTARAVAWNDPDGNPAEPEKTEREPDAPSESFGVAQRVQDLLSRVRTDLDSFTDIEAYSLMLDGYKMSAPELQKFDDFRQGSTGIPPDQPAPRWRFLNIDPWLTVPNQQANLRYLKHLEVARENLFKIFRLNWPITIAAGVSGLALISVLWAMFAEQISEFFASPVTIGALLLTAVMLALGFIAPKLGSTFRVLRFIRSPSRVLVQFVGLILVALIGSWLIALHLVIFDRLFLRYGKLDRLGSPPAARSQRSVD